MSSSSSSSSSPPSFHEFKQVFQSQQSKFQVSSDTQYYIVSTKYLKDWMDYCYTYPGKFVVVEPMNSDIVDAGGELRRELAQGKDFEIVSKKVYDIIRTGGGIEIRRMAVMVEKQKKVPLYLDTIRYIKIEQKDLREIDKSSKSLTLKCLKFPSQSTIKSLIQHIKQNQRTQDKSYQYRKCRLWKNNDQQTNKQKLISYFKQKMKYCMTFYRFDGIGKFIDNQDLILADLQLNQQDYFLVQFSDQYSSFVFKTPEEAKCENCFQVKKLPHICGCKKVAYCTEECMEKDKRFHVRNCRYAEEQELNQEVEMVITKNSSLGRVGLSNLGNTCFMNSCLQCLSNMTPLTQYFLNRYFEKEVNKDNPLGSQGKLAKNYAKFIKGMWCSSQTTFSPYNLKAAVAKLNPIFSGFAQHDSQQFFSYLVDGIHEDLNRVLKKPYVESVDSKGRPDNVVALESWTAYIQRNQSIVVDLMTGQYKSKVVCPVCSLESITFDPFTTISLPLPEQANPVLLKFFTIFANNENKALRASFFYTKQGPKQWLEMAVGLLKRSPNQFVFYILTAFENVYGFHSTSKSELIHKIESESKLVFLLELTPEQQNLKQRLQIVTKFCKKSSHFEEYDNLWFKRPFFYEKNTTTVGQIKQRLIKFLYKIYSKKLSYDEYCNKIQEKPIFTLVLKWKKKLESMYSRIQTTFQKQLVLENPNMKMIDIVTEIGSTDYELDVRFSKDTLQYFEFEKLKEFSDLKQSDTIQSKQSSKKNSTITLDQCFTAFSEKQELEIGNEWYCPSCKEHRLATKQMSVYKAPQILILHLKRFKNKGKYYKQKNQTNVIFPTLLNMKPYLINQQPMSSYIPELRKSNHYIQPVYKCEYNNGEGMYELFAISNHYGGLGGGHYTAFGKNGDRWLEFNDSSVRGVTEDSIKGSGAYMLFYRMQNGFNLI